MKYVLLSVILATIAAAANIDASANANAAAKANAGGNSAGASASASAQSSATSSQPGAYDYLVGSNNGDVVRSNPDNKAPNSPATDNKAQAKSEATTTAVSFSLAAVGAAGAFLL